MELELKRKYRRRIKRLIIAAWSMIALFLLNILMLIFSMTIFGQPYAKVLPAIIPIIFFIVPLFSGMIITSFVTFNKDALREEIKKIYNYRDRRFSTLALEAIADGDLNAASYNFRFIHDGSSKDIIFGLLLSEYSHTDDEKLQKIAANNFKKMHEIWNPDKVKTPHEVLDCMQTKVKTTIKEIKKYNKDVEKLKKEEI